MLSFFTLENECMALFMELAYGFLSLADGVNSLPDFYYPLR